MICVCDVMCVCVLNMCAVCICVWFMVYVCVVYMYLVCVVYVCCIWCICGKPMCFRSVQESEGRGSGRGCLQTSPEPGPASLIGLDSRLLAVHNKAVRLFFFSATGFVVPGKSVQGQECENALLSAHSSPGRPFHGMCAMVATSPRLQFPTPCLEALVPLLSPGDFQR